MISREEIQNSNSQVNMQIPLWVPGETRALALVLLFFPVAVFFASSLRRLKPPVFIPRRRGGALKKSYGVRSGEDIVAFEFLLHKIHIWVNKLQIQTAKHGELWEIQKFRIHVLNFPETH